MHCRFVSLLPPLLALSGGCGTLYLEPVGADGPSIFEIEPAQEVAFGLASPNGAPATREVWLRSQGEGQVVVEEVVMEQDGRGVFTIAFDPSPCVLQDNDELPVEFRFHPDDDKSYSGRVVFVARVNGNELEIARRLSGSGCSDADGDGQCAGAASWYEPEDTGAW